MAWGTRTGQWIWHRSEQMKNTWEKTRRIKFWQRVDRKRYEAINTAATRGRTIERRSDWFRTAFPSVVRGPSTGGGCSTTLPICYLKKKMRKTKRWRKKKSNQTFEGWRGFRVSRGWWHTPQTTWTTSEVNAASSDTLSARSFFADDFNLLWSTEERQVPSRKALEVERIFSICSCALVSS